MRVRDIKDVRPKLLSAGLSSNDIYHCHFVWAPNSRKLPSAQTKGHLDPPPQKQDRPRDTTKDINISPHGERAQPHAAHAVVPKQRYKVCRLTSKYEISRSLPSFFAISIMFLSIKTWSVVEAPFWPPA